MKCLYEFNGKKGLTYSELRKAIMEQINKDPDLLNKINDTLFSAQEDQNKALFAIKKEGIDFAMSKPTFNNMSGEYTSRGKLSINQFINSSTYNPSGSRYKKLSRDSHKEAMIAYYMSEKGGRMSAEAAAQKVEQDQSNWDRTASYDFYNIHKVLNSINLNNAANASEVADAIVQYAMDQLTSVNKEVAKWEAQVAAAPSSTSAKAMLEDAVNKQQSFQRIINNSKKLASSAYDVMVKNFAKNKVSGKSQLVNNIAITCKLNDSTNLFGHIDYAIIDNEGNLALYKYKLTSNDVNAWSVEEKATFRRELAFIKHMLANKEVELEDGRKVKIRVKDASLNIIPIKVDYNESKDTITGIDVKPAQDLRFNLDNRGNTITDAMDRIEDEVNQYLPIEQQFSEETSKKVTLGLDKTRMMFGNLDIQAHMMDKSVQNFIKREYSRRNRNGGKIKNKEGGGYVLTLGGKVYEINDNTTPTENPEIIAKVKEFYEKRNESFRTIAKTLEKEIKNAATTGIVTFDCFRGANQYLKQILSPYIPYKDFDGNVHQDWKIVSNDALASQSIILFQNVHSGQLDAVVISALDLTAVQEINGSKNIMNNFVHKSTDVGVLADIEASWGNIELLKAFNILGETLGDTETNFKLGRLQVISPVKGGQGVFQTFENFNKKYYPKILNITKTNNPGYDFSNPYRKYRFMDSLDVFINTYEALNNPDNNTLSDHDKNDLNFIDVGCKELINTNDIHAKTVILEELLAKLQSNMNITQILDDDSNYSKSLGSRERAIIDLYRSMTNALLNLKGINMSTKNDVLSTFQREYIKINHIPDYNIRLFSTLYTKAIDNINSQMFKDYMPVRKALDELYESKGFGKIQNNLGQQYRAFDNMFETSETGEIGYTLKNPYDNRTDLDDAERKFLKTALFYLTKTRFSMRGENWTYTSPEDSNWITYVNTHDTVLYCPLMKASGKAFNVSQHLETLKNGFKSIARAFTAPKETAQEIIQKFADEWDNVQDNNSILKQSLTATNPFTAFESTIGTNADERNTLIESQKENYFEHNLENVLIDFMYQDIRTKEINKMLITGKSALFALSYMGYEQHSPEYIQTTLDAINKYWKVSITNEPITEKTTQRIAKIITPARRIASVGFLAANVVGGGRDIFQGLSESFWRTINKYNMKVSIDDKDIKYSTVMKAYAIVTKGALRQQNIVTKLCLRYGLSNIDYSDITKGLKTEHGLFNASQLAFITMRLPDYINRMTLFVARAITDGSWDAWSLDKDGNLVYNAKEDERYAAFLNNKTDYKDYTKQKSKYLSHIRIYNQEHPDNTITYNDMLPEAYSNQEIARIKEVADSIYGSYETYAKSLYEKGGLGLILGQFTTYFNGIMANYFASEDRFETDTLGWEQALDINGNKLWFDENNNPITLDESQGTIDEDGNLTINGKVYTPVYDNIPLPHLGIMMTLGKVAKAFARGESIKAIWEDPIEQENLRKAMSDLGCLLLMLLFGTFVGKPMYQEYTKKKYDFATNAAAAYIFKAGSASWDGLVGPLAVFNSLGGSSNVASYTYMVNLYKNIAQATFGSKTSGELIFGLIPATKWASRAIHNHKDD